MVIKKGKHSSYKLPRLVKSKNLKYRITFTESCRYDIGSEDQGDINKLFGFGHINLNVIYKKDGKLKFRPMHHYSSVRFGWRYNLQTDKIEILSYYYDRGIRNYSLICDVEINESFIYEIKELSESSYVLNINDNFSTIVNIPTKSLKYILGLYFGGNKKAPHDIRVEMEKIN
jgi:hypothetical protein